MMKKIHRLGGKKSLALSISLLCAAGGHTLAEDAPKSKVRLEEVIVTASKRDDMLQDVPISIAAVTDDVLKKSNVSAIDELQKLVPNFNMKGATGGSNGAGLTIRGIGTNIFSGGVQGSVGTVIDGVVMGRQGIGMLNFNDVERVEVLRGPQGTLFGMNVSAGLLNIVTREPTERPNADVYVSYGSNDDLKTHAAISGPLIENVLLGRLSLFTEKRDGYIHNLYDGRDLNDDDQKGARGKLAFMPRESTRLELSVDAADRDREISLNGPARELTSTGPAAFRSSPAELQYLTGLASKTNDVVNAAGNTNTQDQIRGVSLQWDESIGDYDLTSITAYRTWHLDNDVGGNNTPFELIVRNANTLDQQQTSEELRIASPTGDTFDYIAGLFYFNQNLRTEVYQAVNQGVVGATAYYSDVDTESYAGFADGNYHINDEFTLFAGARFTHEEVDFRLVGVPTPGAFRFGVPIGTTDDSETTNIWSWRVGTRWTVSADDMLYATISRGFKGAGFNTNSSVLNVSQQVDPEVATNYEVGWKGQFFDSRLRTNVAIFYTRLDDYQASALVNTGNATTSGFFLQNAGELETQGVEFEAAAVPIENLTVNFSATYVDASFKEFEGASCYTGQTVDQGCVSTPSRNQDLSGSRLANTPEWAATLGFQYDWITSSLPFDFFAHADYAWRDEVQWDTFQDPRAVEDAYGQLDASFGLRDKEEHYTVTVYGKNLTDEFHTVGIMPGATTTHLLPEDYEPIYGVSVEWKVD